MDEDRIILEKMVFYGYHGAHPSERELGQRFVVDLELGLDLAAAGRSDALADTVDYTGVYAMVREVVEGPPCNLLEAVAERIASAVLAEPRIGWVRVRLAKPSVAIPGALSAAAVHITRRRHQYHASPAPDRSDVPWESEVDTSPPPSAPEGAA